MGGQQAQSDRFPTVGDGNPGPRHGGHPGCDPGHHLEGDAFGFEDLALFASAAENIGVTTLESNHPKTSSRETHEEGVDLLLGHGVDTRLFADGMEFHLRPKFTGKGRSCEAVVDHRIRFEETLAAANGEQSGATRPGAHEGYETSLDSDSRHACERGFPVDRWSR